MMTSNSQHQYIERVSGRICTERPFADRIIRYLYDPRREQAAYVYRLLGSRWFSGFLGWLNYDFPLGHNLSGIRRFLGECGVDSRECIDQPRDLDSARKIFERKLRYWQCRPMSHHGATIVAPADSRIIVGSLRESSTLFIKGKFFDLEELLGARGEKWRSAFRHADFAICRLTPDKYHYNHTPVAGIVRDYYEHDGRYHSCNPAAVISLPTPYSKNRRAVTVIDTDTENGTGVGLVAMIEVVALMIGDIVQCYSGHAYDHPTPMAPGMFLEKGVPKSMFRPGSSTTVVLFQQSRSEFCGDLIRNLNRSDIASHYSQGLGRPLVETDINVRATIGYRKGGL
jgi:phosphatidylserine decarboxylase